MIDEYLLKIKETTRAKTQLQKTSITSSLYESGLKSRWPTDKYRNRKVFIMLNTCFRQISNIRDIYYWGLLLFGKAYQAKFVLVSLHIDTGPYGQNWNQNNHRNNVMERAKPQKLKIRSTFDSNQDASPWRAWYDSKCGPLFNDWRTLTRSSLVFAS